MSWYNLVAVGDALPGLLVCAVEVDAELVHTVDSAAVERCVQPLLAPIARLVHSATKVMESVWRV